MRRGRGGRSGSRGGWYAGYPAPSRPREAKGGIRAQTGRGAFGQSWWARRWIAVLEGFQLGARLSRGRSYARNGQVLSIEIEAGAVRAQVQGSRPAPYRVGIGLPALDPAAWRRVGEAIAGRAAFAAALLAGQMPQDIEEAFSAAGVSLFPERPGDLRTECSCPDWSNPCKHVAAVYYLIGEEFDRDPFLLFLLRGLDRAGLAQLLSGAAAEPAAQSVPAAPEPLPCDPTVFWNGAPGPLPVPAEASAAVGPALVRRLGNLPFWRGSRPLADAVQEAYADASRRGRALLGWEPEAGGQGPPPTPAPPVPAPVGGAVGPKSRNRAALDADIRAGVPPETLRARYDGRMLRPYLSRGRRPTP